VSEVTESLDPTEPVVEPGLIDDEEAALDEELKEEEKGIGKGGWYIIFASAIIVFFLWMLLGLWGYLQEMSYGHG
jgi:hypothetical protein